MKETQRKICQRVEFVLCYGDEVWVLNKEMKRRLTAEEMEYIIMTGNISILY